MGSGYAAGFDEANEAAYRIRRETAPQLSNAGGDASLHTQMLGLLQKLFKSPAPHAPAFMKSRAWQAKSCQTALAAWTQARHLWTLQAQPHYRVGGGVSGWPAFVEPSPWFFVGLADLCKAADQLLANVETADEISRRIARDLRRQAGEVETIKIVPGSAGEETRIILSESQSSALELLSFMDNWGITDDPFSPETLVKGARMLRESAALIEKQQSGKMTPFAQKVWEECLARNPVRFQALAEICTKLAALAHKQMQGQGPDAGDGEWLEYFGLTLASFTDCHFTHAVDNVPKAARVFTNLRTQKALTAGIGRPRFLYVLYPWDGHEVLCRGAVLPYLERHDLKTYTDDEWRSSLKDAASPPIQPGWVSPLIVR